MSQYLTEAFQAKDGKIFATFEEYTEYESRRFIASAPMYKLNDNNELIITNNATDVNFILLNSPIDKEAFIELRKTALSMLPGMEDQAMSFEYSVDGLNELDSSNNAYYGIYAIFSIDKDAWTWMPIEDYIKHYEQILTSAKDSVSMLTQRYLANYSIEG